MCGGPEAPPPSKAEQFQAQRALRRLDEWEQDGYKQLEEDGLKRSNDDFGRVLANKANADANAMQAENEKMAGMFAGQGNMSSVQGDADRSFRHTLTQAKTNAAMDGEQIRDQRRVGMAKVGNNVSLTLDNAFNNAAQRGFSKAQADMQATTMRNRARTQALVDVAGAGALKYMDRSKSKSGGQAAPAQPAMPQQSVPHKPSSFTTLLN